MSDLELYERPNCVTCDEPAHEEIRAELQSDAEVYVVERHKRGCTNMPLCPLLPDGSPVKIVYVCYRRDRCATVRVTL